MLPVEVILDLQEELGEEGLGAMFPAIEIEKDLEKCWKQKSFGPWFRLETHMDNLIAYFKEKEDQSFDRVEPYVNLLLASSS